MAKGETLVDTGKTLDAQKNDFIVMRHPMGGGTDPLRCGQRRTAVFLYDQHTRSPPQHSMSHEVTLCRKGGEIGNLSSCLAPQAQCLPLGEGAPVRTLGRMRVSLMQITKNRLIYKGNRIPSSVKNQRFLTASPRGSLGRSRAIANIQTAR